jgi:hypothetical protein
MKYPAFLCIAMKKLGPSCCHKVESLKVIRAIKKLKYGKWQKKMSKG